MKKTTLKTLGILLLALTIMALIPPDVWARAGGGGGRGGGGILALILYPFFLIYSAIATYIACKKNKECKDLVDRLSRKDPGWNMNNIKGQVETAYFKVQQAWTERNQDLARDYVSDRLYNLHKSQTDAMIREHRQNVLERINLKSAKVVQVADYRDDSKDALWVLIEGSMIDYMVDDRSGNKLSGDSNKPESFSELWKFIRGAKGNWVLDEIDQNAGITHLQALHSFTESKVS